MSIITTGLPAPAAALNGIELPTSEDVRDQYSIIATGGGFWVARALNQNIIVKSVNGIIREYEATCSTAFEASVAVDRGSLYFTYIRNGKIFLNVINLTENTLISEQFLAADTAHASLIPDILNDRIIIFKHDPSLGINGRAWLFSVDVFTFQVTNHFYQASGRPPVLIHLYSDAGVLYRSYLSSTINKITRLNQTNLNGEIYQENPASGEVVIQNINSIDLYYPTVVGDRVYVLSQDATEFSAWSTTTANTQVITPFVIDSRAELQHAASKVQYGRIQFDTSTNLLLDTRTFFIWDTATETEEIERYPVCAENGVVQTYDIDVTDRQPVRSLAVDAELGFYRVNNQNRLYELNENAFCPLVDEVEAKQHEIIDGARRLPFLALENHVGSIDATSAASGYAVFLNNDLTITTQGTTITVNGTSYSLPGQQLLVMCKIFYEGKFYVRTGSDFRIYDEVSSTLVPAATLATRGRHGFIYNNKFYVFTAQTISILDLSDNSVEDIVINQSRPNRVRIFANPFNNNLYLYDKDVPTELRRLKFAPAGWDYGDPLVIPEFTELVTDIFPTTVDKSTTPLDWSITQISPDHILYVDYENELYEIIFRNSILTFSGSVTARAEIESQPNIISSGRYVFDRNIEEVINIRDGLFPQSQFKMEALSSENSALADSPDGKLAVSTDTEGFLQFLTDGVIDGAANTSYVVTFNREFVREAVSQPYIDNVLRMTYRSNVNGRQISTVDIVQEEIEQYRLVPVYEIINDDAKVQTSEAKQVLYKASVNAVVDTDKLKSIMELFYNQWSDSAEDQQWEMFIDDTIYEQNVGMQTARAVLPLSTGVATTQFVRHSVAITNIDYEWFSDEKWRVSLEAVEVTINDDEIILI